MSDESARSLIWLLDDATTLASEGEIRLLILRSGGDPEQIMPVVRQYRQMSPFEREQFKEALLAQEGDPKRLGAFDRALVFASTLIGTTFGVDASSTARERVKATRGGLPRLLLWLELAVLAGLAFLIYVAVKRISELLLPIPPK